MARLPEVDRQAAGRAAIAARRARAEVKRQIAARELDPLEAFQRAIVDSSSTEAGLRVPDFLRAIPAIGRLKADRILQRLGISPVKRLGALGRRQRGALQEFLVAWQAQHGIAHGTLLVLAGPTAVGKGTVVSHILANNPDVHLSVSATTRSPRPGEREGEHYYFVDDVEFDRLIEAGDMLEWALVHDVHRYGTPRGPVEAALNAGKNVLLEIDIQGARSVKQAMPHAHMVFLMPPSWEELVRRLTGRGTESVEEQERRLSTARVELSAAGEFDTQVVNDHVVEAAQKVVDLMTASRGLRVNT